MKNIGLKVNDSLCSDMLYLAEHMQTNSSKINLKKLKKWFSLIITWKVPVD